MRALVLFVVTTTSAIVLGIVIGRHIEQREISGAGGGLHVRSEVWYDITRDNRTVAMPNAVPPDEVALYGQDATSQLDVLINNGGTPTGVMRIRLTLVNYSKAPAVINELRARVTSKESTPAGSTFSCGGPEGGVDQSRVRLDLGAQEKVAEEFDGAKIVGRYPVEARQISKVDEPAIFDIEVKAGLEAYAFVIDVSYVQGEKTGKVVVDDAGKSYKLAPLNNRAEHYECDVRTGGWSRQ